MLSRRCQSDEDWHQVSCHSFPCQRRFCRRRRRGGGGCCCCGRLPQSACVLFQSPSQSIIHCDRARRREGEREAAGRREREAAGRREAGSSEGRRERAEELGKRRESAERSSASGVEAREGGGPPAPGPGQRAAPPPSSARARGGACIVRGCEERGCGLGPPRAQDTVAGGRGAARWVRRGPE